MQDVSSSCKPVANLQNDFDPKNSDFEFNLWGSNIFVSKL